MGSNNFGPISTLYQRYDAPRLRDRRPIIALQAQRRWEEQQDEFVRRRRDHEMRMIAMEATEAERREEEIRRRIEGLDEQKRKNRCDNYLQRCTKRIFPGCVIKW